MDAFAGHSEGNLVRECGRVASGVGRVTRIPLVPVIFRGVPEMVHGGFKSFLEDLPAGGVDVDGFNRG